MNITIIKGYDGELLLCMVCAANEEIVVLRRCEIAGVVEGQDGCCSILVAGQKIVVRHLVEEVLEYITLNFKIDDSEPQGSPPILRSVEAESQH